MISNESSTEKVMVRLSQEQYLALEQEVGSIAVTGNISSEAYAFQLGIQHVLQKLRSGYVVS